jgi:hypothetical protein
VLKVIPPAVSGTAQAGDVRSSKSFSSQLAGVGQVGGLVTRAGGQTITPGTADQALAAGIYDSVNTVKGDTNLIPANIPTGVTLFGVVGANSGSNPAPAGTAAATDVLTGKTFSNATQSNVAGAMPNQGSPTITPSSAGNTLAAGYYSGCTVSPGTPLASGTATSSSTTSNYKNVNTTTTTAASLTVNGLTFTPKRIVITSDSNGGFTEYNADSAYVSNSISGKIGFTASSAAYGYNLDSTTAPASVSSTGFTMPVGNASQSYRWDAYA